ncbi:carbohydrate ABC transporter substrate-binding protein, partial [Streptomyces sp. NPDC096068]
MSMTVTGTILPSRRGRTDQRSGCRNGTLRAGGKAVRLPAQWSRTDQNIAQQITNALSEVERKGVSPEKSWSNAKKGVEN